MFMLHEQDNGSMMGPLNVEHFRFDDADIAMVIPQQACKEARHGKPIIVAISPFFAAGMPADASFSQTPISSGMLTGNQ